MDHNGHNVTLKILKEKKFAIELHDQLTRTFHASRQGQFPYLIVQS